MSATKAIFTTRTSILEFSTSYSNGEQRTRYLLFILAGIVIMFKLRILMDTCLPIDWILQSLTTGGGGGDNVLLLTAEYLVCLCVLPTPWVR